MTDQKRGAAHTEGPWEVEPVVGENTLTYYRIRDAAGEAIAGVYYKSVANARLIAAAPTNPHDCGDPECPGQQRMDGFRDLLEALQEAVDLMTEAAYRSEAKWYLNEHDKRFRSAIAKAGG